MDIIDISLWNEAEDLLWTAGKREKTWMINSNTDQTYLFKKPKNNGEMYAEVITFKIGTELFGLEIPYTEFAVFQETVGTISKSFITDLKKYEFREAVDYYGDSFDAMNLQHYTVEKTIEIVEKLDVKENFFDMCIFDYLIANQDRHSQNWGIITEVKTDYKTFAPLYDNGSSLLNGIKDERLLMMSKDLNMFKAYHNRATSIFTINNQRKPKHLELIKFLIENDKELFSKSFSRFKGVEYDTLYQVVNRIDMSELRKEMICKLVLSRIELIREQI